MDKLPTEVFILEHVYELTDDFGPHDEIKHLGVFSSEEKANEAIEFLKDKEGFRDHPLSCFEISCTVIDRVEWTEGFVTVTWHEEED